MALAAHSTRPLASYGSLHQDRMRYPRYYAEPARLPTEQSPPPFVYTGPRLQSASGSPKAKKVLGLVAQFERKSIEDEERGGPIKAQRTLGLVTHLPRDRALWRNSGSGHSKGAPQQKLEQADKEIRRLSRMHGLAVAITDQEDEAARDERSGDDEDERNQGAELRNEIENDVEEGEEDEEEEASQPDLEKIPILELPISQSPQQLFFSHAPIELDAGPDHELLLPPRRPRARPHSYTSPRFSDRPKSKIASSRSRGLSSPPNFSRPLSGFAPKPVPGEDMERDPLSVRFHDLEDDPRSPMSPIGGAFVSNEIKAALEQLEMGIRSRANSPMPPSPPPPPAKRASKPRWSSLPVSLMKLAHKRKSSRNEENGFLLPMERKESKEVVTLTEENLQRWEDEVGYVPKMYRMGYDLLKSPVELDMEVERCTPVPPMSKTPSPRPDALALAHAQGQMLTPPMSLSPPVSPPLRQVSSNGSTIDAMASMAATPTLSQDDFASSASLAMRSSTTSVLIHRFPEPPSHYSPPPPPPPPPQHTTEHPSLAQQKEALSLKPNQLLTCVLCSEVEHPSAFPAQPLSASCLHAARTCKECIQHVVERAMAKRESVRCPECSVAMSADEVLVICNRDTLRGIARRHADERRCAC